MPTGKNNRAPRANIQKKREAMRNKVLAAAAVQINQRGAASLDLKALGETVGLSRNSLYHYFSDKKDLAYRCYLKSEQDLQEDLSTTADAGGSAIENLQRFVEVSLAKRSYENAVLSDVDALNPSQRAEILALEKANMNALQELFDKGIQAGDLRQHNAEIASRSLLGVMRWARLWFRWTGRYRSEKSRFLAKTAGGIADGFLFGLATNRDYVDENPIRLEAVTATDFDAFDSGNISEQKRLQLIGAASRVFNRKGIAATSIDDISNEIRATKGAVYHYFDDKEHLLAACYERAFDLYEMFNQAGESRGEGTLLALATPLHLNCQAQASRYPPLVLQAGLANIPQHVADRANASSKRLHRTRREAIRRGECREGGSLFVDLSPGTFFWVQKWMADNPSRTVESLANDVVAIVVNGVAA